MLAYHITSTCEIHLIFEIPLPTTLGSTKINLKGLIYRLFHDSQFDIDCEFSTAHCKSSSGVSVELLSRTICTTVFVSDWCITNLSHIPILTVHTYHNCSTFETRQ